MLLEGEETAGTCDAPLSEQERHKITIQHEGTTTTIARVTCPTAPKFWRWRDLPWPKVVQRDVEFLESAEHIEEHINEWKPQLAAAILCGVCGLTAYLFRGQSWSIAGYLLAYLAGGWFTAEEVWERLRERAIDVHFLMLAVAVGSASIGAWAEGATLLFLFSLSGALEHFALGRTQKEIRSLFREAPKVATVLDEQGREREVKVEQLRPGMRLLIKPGAQFPVDAEIARGQTAADESNLTGEATPVEKAVGDSVLAGTINLWGAVETVVLRPAAESSLQKIIRLIKEAQHQKAPSQQFTDKFSTYYTYLALGISLVMFFVWWLGFGYASLRFQSRIAQRVLPNDDIARGGLALRAGAFDSFRGAGGNRVEREARDSLPRRRGGGKAGGRGRRGARQNRDAYDRRIASRNSRELSAREGSRNRAARLFAGKAFHASAGAGDNAAWQATRNSSRSNSIISNLSPARVCARARTDANCLLGRREWVAANTDQTVRRSALNGFTKTTECIGRSRRRSRRFGNLARGRRFARAGSFCATTSGRSLAPCLRISDAKVFESVVLTGDRKATAEHLRAELQLDDVRAELNPENKVAESAR